MALPPDLYTWSTLDGPRSVPQVYKHGGEACP